MLKSTKYTIARVWQYIMRKLWCTSKVVFAAVNSRLTLQKTSTHPLKAPVRGVVQANQKRHDEVVLATLPCGFSVALQKNSSQKPSTSTLGYLSLARDRKALLLQDRLRDREAKRKKRELVQQHIPALGAVEVHERGLVDKHAVLPQQNVGVGDEGKLEVLRGEAPDAVAAGLA